MRHLILFALFSIGILTPGCKKEVTQKTENFKERDVSQDFKNYWYQGEAEITSYTLSQERYGEMRDAEAVLIFVTEDFLSQEQVKANKQSNETIAVLKLNSTKTFLTGIYPYSLMTSTFYPVYQDNHALKVSTSVQEWCGHIYAQINNRNQFEVTSHSYFENEADQKFSIAKTWLEDEFWTLLRIDPSLLPTGEIASIPSLEFSRLRHINIAAVPAIATLTENDKLNSYSIEYPEYNRTLTIWFQNTFPFGIEKWEERIGEYTSTATKKAQIQSAYWNQNKKIDEGLRDSLYNK